MRITETTDNDNNVSSFTGLLDTGNLVPTIWYHKLLRECGKSDCTAIAILSELVLLHRDHGSNEFQLNFKYFKDKFNFGLSQVKDAVIRLEKLGLVARSPRTVIILGRSFANAMFLVLNIEKVLELTDETNLSDGTNVNVIRPEKFQQSIRNNDNPPVEISSEVIGKAEKTQVATENSQLPYTEISAGGEDKTAKLGDFLGNFHLPSVEISSVLYIDISKNNLKSRYIDRLRDRYSKSGFLEISDEENKNRDIEGNEQADSLVGNLLQTGEVTKAPAQDEAKTKTELIYKNASHAQPIPTPTPEKQPSVITRIRSKFSFFGKKLSEFHPLSDEDRAILVTRSGRDFDLNFINQLMMRISDKYPKHKFYNNRLRHELYDQAASS